MTAPIAHRSDIIDALWVAAIDLDDFSRAAEMLRTYQLPSPGVCYASDLGLAARELYDALMARPDLWHSVSNAALSVDSDGSRSLDPSAAPKRSESTLSSTQAPFRSAESVPHCGNSR